MTTPGIRGSASSILDGYSLEISAKAIPALIKGAPRIAPASTICMPYLPGEGNDARLAAARAVRGLGLEPMLHVPARRIASFAALEAFVRRAVAEAGVERCLVIAGDPSRPQGPFADSASLIETGLFERAGIKTIAVAGHPEGHPAMSAAECWEVLARKCGDIHRRGMSPWIFTQFSFDADIVLGWLQALRERGLEHPVRVGVAGPTSVAVLARYAASCGVGASASMWRKYGVSIGKLLGTAGPDRFVDRLAGGLTQAHGTLGLHVFPFGGVARSLDWVAQYRARVAS